MITPTKGISPDRSLLAVGAQIAKVLDMPMTVTQTWSRFREERRRLGHHSPVSFQWFVLGLDVLYALGVIEFRNELLVRRNDLLVGRRDDAATSER
ncbi:ABC-three component system middle component 6 [Streptomyces sp. NPDC057939]|uniref:ABC-three component system middle component 6 n=1 Tax=Streptomyces sp. NPDC057939 TaxID=3346284 RepID=UPI0036E2724F